MKRLLIAAMVCALMLGQSAPARAQPVLGAVAPASFPANNVQTGTTLTATFTSADITVPQGARTVELVLSVTGTVSGTTPTLNGAVKFKDAQGQALYAAPNALVTANITATSTQLVLVVGPSASNTANFSAIGVLPPTIQVVLTVGGTTPSFAGVYATLVWN